MHYNRRRLQDELTTYASPYADEMLFTSSFNELLTHQNAFERTNLPGHMTGSAWIVDTTGKYILLTHHAKLNRWLQPGGHADGDENIYAVSLREAQEETGLQKTLTLWHEGIFDIDIHTIPARGDFPEHLHYDIRFMFKADRDEPLQITDESHNLQWIALEQLDAFTNGNASINRMLKKTVSLLRTNE